MALNIRNDEVDELAKQLSVSLRTTKTQAVKIALQNELDRTQKKTPLWERLKPLRDEISAYPETGEIIDKAFFDRLSGEDEGEV